MRIPQIPVLLSPRFRGQPQFLPVLDAVDLLVSWTNNTGFGVQSVTPNGISFQVAAPAADIQGYAIVENGIRVSKVMLDELDPKTGRKRDGIIIYCASDAIQQRHRVARNLAHPDLPPSESQPQSVLRAGTQVDINRLIQQLGWVLTAENATVKASA